MKKSILRSTFSIFVVLVLIALIYNTGNSSEYSLPPCCNNMNPFTNNAPIWSYSCGNCRDTLISRQCCIDIWNRYGQYPVCTSPCPWITCGSGSQGDDIRNWV